MANKATITYGDTTFTTTNMEVELSTTAIEFSPRWDYLPDYKPLTNVTISSDDPKFWWSDTELGVSFIDNGGGLVVTIDGDLTIGSVKSNTSINQMVHRNATRS